jgi:hypothetical protein
MTIDTSVGVSNTAGYSFTGGDPTATGGIVSVGNGITSYTQMGGSRKGSRKGGGPNCGDVHKKGGGLRRMLTKKLKRMSKKRIRSVKKYVKKKKKKRKQKKRIKRRTVRQDIINSIESGRTISNKSKGKLTPNMREFLKGIEPVQKTGDTVKFSDFKTKSMEKKNKKKRKSRSRIRGGGLLSLFF